jgi:hypothetical protein
MLSIRTGSSVSLRKPCSTPGGANEGAGRGLHLFVAEHERHLALGDVEGVVLVGVDVVLEIAPGRDLDDPEREARRVHRSREELHVPHTVSFTGRHDDR